MILQAINPKNQSLVNKAINWLIKHNNYNDLRDIADGNGNAKDYKKYDNKCINSFDKYLDYLYELPKNQQKAIENLDIY
tara:strand:- start:143 stop:379 length:237 start_codon:yes stop_codon:yes gene_type:complete